MTSSGTSTRLIVIVCQTAITMLLVGRRRGGSKVRGSAGAIAIAGGEDGDPISVSTVSGARVVVVVVEGGGGDAMMANGAADGGSCWWLVRFTLVLRSVGQYWKLYVG